MHYKQYNVCTTITIYFVDHYKKVSSLVEKFFIKKVTGKWALYFQSICKYLDIYTCACTNNMSTKYSKIKCLTK